MKSKTQWTQDSVGRLFMDLFYNTVFVTYCPHCDHQASFVSNYDVLTLWECRECGASWLDEE